MRLFWLALGLALLAWTAASAVTQIGPGEKAVVRRFGRILDDKPGPGLFIGLPWGLDRVERKAVALERRVLVGWTGKEDADEQAVTPSGQVLTGDHNLVNVRAQIQYSVIEEEIDRFVLASDRVDLLVERVAEGLLGEWIAGRSVDDVLLFGKKELPDFLTRNIAQRIERYELGIRITQASIANLDPPDEVKDSFDRLAQAATYKSTQENQARQSADRKRSEAAAEVIRLGKLAAAYAEEQRLAAQAEAVSFLDRLSKYRQLAARDPGALNAIWQDDMTRLYARMREAGRIDILDHFLSGEGLNITQFPLLPKKK